MLGTTLPTPMYALYGERMHFALFTTTVIFATYAVGVLGALLLFGRWSDVLGRRPLLLAGAAFALVSAVIFLVADDIALLLIAPAVVRLLGGHLHRHRHRRRRGGRATRASRPRRRRRDDRQHRRARRGADAGGAAGPVRARPPRAVVRGAHRADRAGRRRSAAGAGDLVADGPPRRPAAVGTRRDAGRLHHRGDRSVRGLCRDGPVQRGGAVVRIAGHRHRQPRHCRGRRRRSSSRRRSRSCPHDGCSRHAPSRSAA